MTDFKVSMRKHGGNFDLGPDDAAVILRTDGSHEMLLPGQDWDDEVHAVSMRAGLLMAVLKRWEEDPDSYKAAIREFEAEGEDGDDETGR